MSFEAVQSFIAQNGLADRVHHFGVSSATVQLAAEALGQVPDLPALDGLRPVQSCGAVGADAPRALGGCAGRAVAVAPAEEPVGEGAEAFFS